MNIGGVDAFDGGQLRAARKKAGLTQETLAEAIAATRPDSQVASGQTIGPTELRKARREVELLRLQVIAYEKGETKPRPPALARLATALGVDPVDLLDKKATWTLTLLRTCHGLLQSEVAEAIGVSRSTYSSVERGALVLGAEQRRQLAILLNITIDELDEAFSERLTVGAVRIRQHRAATKLV